MMWVCPVLASVKTVSLWSHSVPEQEIDVDRRSLAINLAISRTITINRART